MQSVVKIFNVLLYCLISVYEPIQRTLQVKYMYAAPVVAAPRLAEGLMPFCSLQPASYRKYFEMDHIERKEVSRCSRIVPLLVN